MISEGKDICTTTDEERKKSKDEEEEEETNKRIHYLPFKKERQTKRK